ncbi:vitamin K epoxide reductase family protein [Paraliomyxa miuraensis]|uniref:vitamin K epoxide reductase family protein n=1 Tax=Paraliomyxa miuraensis TaxID=376150 RepID=UPI0022537605|nr:vitamin K epoxide reductase family protein [Paraliomyxa miuraensis]MCX4243446.1 hypothetical protein [Paraliomyxa miuraensis]
MWTRIFAVGLLLGALLGLGFAGVSTLDFVQHLDRQVHDLHCSFAPGLVEPDEESTGCQVTLLSPYSSIMRTSLWGGIPISLPAMAVFAFLAFRAVEILVAPPARRRTTAAIALAATAVPVIASAVMGYVAFTELHAACKLCIGIYISSGVALVMALGAWLSARREPGSSDGPPPRAAAAWLAAVGQGVAFVTVPVVAYALVVPDYAQRYIGTCGALAEPDDPYGVMVPLGPPSSGASGGAPAIEVFDPLCPSCRGFEERLHASGLDQRLRRHAVMFPLDSECNWMVTRSLHPGACRVSQAVLCAATVPAVGPDAVVAWAFEQQEALLAQGKSDLEGVSRMIIARFPELQSCLGSPEVESRLNKSLRWTVKNQLPVMTPQLYVAGVKLCDEDSDLGMDFVLDRMLQQHAAGTLKSTAPAPAAPAEPALVPGSEAPATNEASKGGKTAKGKTAKPAAPAGTKPSEPKPTAPEPADPKPTEPAAQPDSKLPTVEELPPPEGEEDDGGTP